MAAESTPPNHNRGGRPESAQVSAVFLRFSAIRQPALRLALLVLPVVAILMGGIGLGGQDPMYATAMLCLAVELVIFRLLLDSLAKTFHALWDHGVIGHRASAFLGVERLSQSLDDAVTKTEQGKERIVLFMREFDRSLNTPAQWLWGGIPCIIPVIWRFIYYKGHQRFLTARPFDHLVTNIVWARVIGLAALVAESIFAITIGLLIWRLLIIGIRISRACEELSLTPRPQHPDHCGGFKPLGELCLMMAFVVTVPGLFLGAWTLLPPKVRNAFSYGSAYTGLYELLLSVMIVFAIISFFFPLWSVHKVLVDEANRMKGDLGRLGRRISNLAGEILAGAESRSFDDCEKMKKSLDFLRQVYEENARFPAWPFDVQITTKLLLSQALPAFTLIKEAWKVLGHS